MMGVLKDIGAEAGDSATSLLKDPKGFIFSAVALWVVKNVFIQPSLWFLALVEDGGVQIQKAFSMVQTSISQGVSPAAEGLSSTWDRILAAASAPLVNAGIAAPLAASLVTALAVVIMVTLLVLLVRIIVDAIPGGGAFL